MRLRAETNGSMQFRVGEINDDLWDIEKKRKGRTRPGLPRQRGGPMVNWTTDRRG